ncbi:MAG: molybdopterin-dependent oxidoreductase [Alphaproteobacteria bacterium]|nr:molybdopterin-dependent oxidoreductase [Alphaproteobacteria bacterium]
MSEARTVRSYCRICQGFCGMRVTIEDGRVADVRGDRDDPLSRGYACFKGLQAVEQHYGAARLLRSLRRRDDRFEPAPSGDILDEIGRRLAAVVAEHGPESVAFFTGTQSLFSTPAPMMVAALAAGLGTPRSFTTMTIDQSAKWIAEARMGNWDAGPQRFAEADVWMFVGSNPLVSMVAGAGANQFAFADPVKTMKQARDRGMKFIVIDPRRTETARFADIFLQPRPGRDGELAAAMLHVILREGWHDAPFCADYVDGLDDLKAAVEPFAPERCADWIGVAPEDIVAAAALFARDSRSGMAGSGTGPDMARHSNLAEHLIQALNVVCGRFPREGEAVGNPGVLQPRRAPRAEVVPAHREWESGPRSTVHGLGRIKGGMMSAVIADEILDAGASRIRALICVGGNLAVALPDQVRAVEALSALDLLVVIDPRMTATARLADYVVAPRLQYERPDHTGFLERMFPVPFAHWTPALVPPPDGSDVVDDWYALWAIARAAGVPLRFAGRDLPMDVAPSTDDVLAILAMGDPAAVLAVREAEAGGFHRGEAVLAGPRTTDARFQLLSADVAEELKSLGGQMAVSIGPEAEPPCFQLTVRRHRETMNSTGADFAATWRRMSGNPAYLHPDDMTALGLTAGDSIEIGRGGVSIGARVQPDADLRRGVLSIGHCWPGLAERPLEATNALVDADEGVQAINRMPVMTGMTVEVRRTETRQMQAAAGAAHG